MAKNILIIEDDEFLRTLISRKLSSEGFSVFVALEGRDGIKKTKEVKLDLILLDLILPNIDGFEVLQKVKEDQSTAIIPVIVLSNLDQKADIDKALKLGAAGYLIKAQITPDEIVEKVKAVLEKK